MLVQPGRTPEGACRGKQGRDGAGHSSKRLKHPQSVPTAHPWTLGDKGSVPCCCILWSAAPSHKAWMGWKSQSHPVVFPTNPSSQGWGSHPSSILLTRTKDPQEGDGTENAQLAALSRLIPAACPEESIWWLHSCMALARWHGAAGLQRLRFDRPWVSSPRCQKSSGTGCGMGGRFLGLAKAASSDPKPGGKTPARIPGRGVWAGFPRAWVFLLTLVRLGVMERAHVNVSRAGSAWASWSLPSLRTGAGWLWLLVDCSDFGVRRAGICQLRSQQKQQLPSPRFSPGPN